MALYPQFQGKQGSHVDTGHYQVYNDLLRVEFCSDAIIIAVDTASSACLYCQIVLFL